MKTGQKILRAVITMLIPFVGVGIGYVIVGAGEITMWATGARCLIVLGVIGYKS